MQPVMVKKTPLPISSEQIEAAVCRIAKEIHSRYERQPVSLVVIMKGAYRFGGDLAQEMAKLGMRVSVEFIGTRAYEGARRLSAEDTLMYNPPSFHVINKRRVIVVDDIVKTGTTLTGVCNYLTTLQPRSIECSVLLSQVHLEFVNRDYVGFFVGSTAPFVVGYGLDYCESFRELDEIREVTDEEKKVADDAIEEKLTTAKAGAHT